jgi:hypothetical protein
VWSLSGAGAQASSFALLSGPWGERVPWVRFPGQRAKGPTGCKLHSRPRTDLHRGETGDVYAESAGHGREIRTRSGKWRSYRPASPLSFFCARRPTSPFFRYGLPPALQRASWACCFSLELRGAPPEIQECCRTGNTGRCNYEWQRWRRRQSGTSYRRAQRGTRPKPLPDSL